MTRLVERIGSKWIKADKSASPIIPRAGQKTKMKPPLDPQTLIVLSPGWKPLSHPGTVVERDWCLDSTFLFFPSHPLVILSTLRPFVRPEVHRRVQGRPCSHSFLQRLRTPNHSFSIKCRALCCVSFLFWCSTQSSDYLLNWVIPICNRDWC